MSESAPEVVASIYFDSWLDESPELRAEMSADDRHLIYEAKGVILDLLIRPLPDRAASHISGQVLIESSEMEESFDEVSHRAVFLDAPQHSYSTNTNELGEFVCSLVPEATWDLTVELRDRRFVVRGVSNAERRDWRSSC